MGGGYSVILDGGNVGLFRAVSSIPGGDTSNLLLRITTGSGDVVLKSYRFLDTGNREPEILARLHARKIPHVSRHLGDVALGRGKDRFVIVIVIAHADSSVLFT